MALKNAEGNYFKIVYNDLNSKNIEFRVFENQEHRDSGETEFHKAKIERLFVESEWDKSLMNFTKDETKTDEENIVTCLYELAKTFAPYSEMENC